MCRHALVSGTLRGGIGWGWGSRTAAATSERGGRGKEVQEGTIVSRWCSPDRGAPRRLYHDLRSSGSIPSVLSRGQSSNRTRCRPSDRCGIAIAGRIPIEAERRSAFLTPEISVRPPKSRSDLWAPRKVDVAVLATTYRRSRSALVRERQHHVAKKSRRPESAEIAPAPPVAYRTSPRNRAPRSRCDAKPDFFTSELSPRQTWPMLRDEHAAI